MGYRDTLMITYLKHPIPWGGSQHEVYSSEPHKLKAMMCSLWESRATDDVIFTIHLLLVRWGYIESHLYLKPNSWLICRGLGQIGLPFVTGIALYLYDTYVI